MKNLKNLGEILNKEEQQSINGGGFLQAYCSGPTGQFCAPGHICCRKRLCSPVSSFAECP